MKALGTVGLAILVTLLVLRTAGGSDFRPAESALGEYRSLRYENVYTTVPTTGKLVSIKITDNGTIYYICREKSGYAIYHLEYRPVENFRDKMQQELKEKSRNWEKTNPDELLFTKDACDREAKRQMNKYMDAVWVRNEIVVPEPREPHSGR
jgi:hypothetical protein